MKISIITVVYNNKDFIEDCIDSVIAQSYQNIEYIIIDGNSNDGTLSVVKKYEKHISKWISESDSGIYDAMNKGIKLATGEVIGMLNSDDIYSNKNVIEHVMNLFKKMDIDGCYGDLLYVSKDLKENVRYWKAGVYKEGKFRKGWMPPHPTFFVRKKFYEKFGGFNSDFEISADYELMLRFIEKKHLSIYYLPEIIIKMRIGGKSNKGVKNLLKKSIEDYKAWKVNNMRMSPLIMVKKPLSKIGQFFRRFDN